MRVEASCTDHSASTRRNWGYHSSHLLLVRFHRTRVSLVGCRSMARLKIKEASSKLNSMSQVSSRVALAEAMATSLPAPTSSNPQLCNTKRHSSRTRMKTRLSRTTILQTKTNFSHHFTSNRSLGMNRNERIVVDLEAV